MKQKGWILYKDWCDFKQEEYFKALHALDNFITKQYYRECGIQNKYEIFILTMYTMSKIKERNIQIDKRYETCMYSYSLLILSKLHTRPSTAKEL